MSAQASPPRRRRVPYPLRALLLVLVVLAATHLWASRTLLARRAELNAQTLAIQDARSELGRQAADPTQLSVMAFVEDDPTDPMPIPGGIAWRLFVPRGSHWRLHWALEGIPQSGLPGKERPPVSLAPDRRGECVVTIKWEKRLDGRWTLRLTIGRVEHEEELSVAQAKWLTQDVPLLWLCAGTRPDDTPLLETFPVNQSTELLRCQKKFDSSRTVRNPWPAFKPPTPEQLKRFQQFDPSCGILIWLESVD